VYLEHDGKFWEIEKTARTLTTRSGRIGSKGTTKKASFKGDALASGAYAEQVDAKRKAGFRDPTKALPLHTAPREPALEAAVRADRGDHAAYDVYADWLEAHGNALGELIGLQRALATKKDAAKTKRANALVRGHKLPAKLMTVAWKWGFWDQLRLENHEDWMDDNFDALELAKFAFGHTACATLRELRLGILRWEHNSLDVPAILAEAKRHAWSADLEALVLGDVGRDIDMAHHVVGRVGTAVSAAFPRLRTLKIHSSEQAWSDDPHTFGLAGLDLPLLEKLVIETISLSKQRAKELLAAKLPKLTELELWIGTPDYLGDAKLSSLAPLLAGATFPHLTKLGICNAEFEGKLAREIHESPLARQLTELNLSKGTIEDADALVLASNARFFPKLTVLDVSDNYLTRDGTNALKQAFKRVELRMKDQRVDEIDEDDDGDRYVAVSE
jgi:uncharacterized protein (TIGR02996 family)